MLADCVVCSTSVRLERTGELVGLETRVGATSVSDTNTAASTSRGWVGREGRALQDPSFRSAREDLEERWFRLDSGSSMDGMFNCGGEFPQT